MPSGSRDLSKKENYDRISNAPREKHGSFLGISIIIESLSLCDDGLLDLTVLTDCSDPSCDGSNVQI